MTGAEVIEGEPSARGRKVAIVAARFNDFIVASLLKGEQAAWLERGGAAQDLTVVRVPGAFELPVVAFDLRETRRSAGDAAVYVKPNDVHDYAAAIAEILEDEPKRHRLGKLGRTRVEQELAWGYQQRAYLDVYRRLTGSGNAPERAEA